jgi:pseudouridine kinase
MLCAGGAVKDTIFRLHGQPVAGTSNPASVSESFGGVACNVARNLATLGRRAEFITAIGDDDAGRALVRELEQAGVGTQFVRTVPGHATAQYMAVLDPAGELTLGVAAMDVLAAIEPGWLHESWPADGWLFCDTNLRTDVLAEAVDRARGPGTRLVVDAVSTAKVVRLPSRLHGVSLFSCNRDEARAWLQHNGFDDAGDGEQLAARLLDAGAGAVLVTLGAGGVVAAAGDGVHHVPAVPATLVDVTGAGDALIAAAILVLSRGGSLLEAAHQGVRRAAQVIERSSACIR